MGWARWEGSRGPGSNPRLRGAAFPRPAAPDSRSDASAKADQAWAARLPQFLGGDSSGPVLRNRLRQCPSDPSKARGARPGQGGLGLAQRVEPAHFPSLLPFMHSFLQSFIPQQSLSSLA